MFIGYKDGSIIFGGTTNQPHDNLVITLDEMEQLAAFYQHEQDKTAVKEYLKTAINILGSAEISTELAKKYLYDAGLLDQLVEESNHSQENFGDNFLTSIAKGIEALEKRLDVKEWEGLPEPVANRMAHGFIDYSYSDGTDGYLPGRELLEFCDEATAAKLIEAR